MEHISEDSSQAKHTVYFSVNVDSRNTNMEIHKKIESKTQFL